VITLYGSGRIFGLPDASPFVTKAEVLLRMAGLAYGFDGKNFRKAPKGKIPFIDDDGEKVADSTFIRWHIEKKYSVDFDAGYTAAERAAAWAFEKMAEDQLYWAIVDLRWGVQANFDKGPRVFFKPVPALLRPLVVGMVRRKVFQSLNGQGFGRHARPEIERLAIAALKAVSDFLGDKPFLLGERPCGADAAIYANVGGVLCPIFDSPLRTAAEAMPNLVAYRDRMTARYYPEGLDVPRRG